MLKNADVVFNIIFIFQDGKMRLIYVKGKLIVIIVKYWKLREIIFKVEKIYWYYIKYNDVEV